MPELVKLHNAIPPMREIQIDNVRQLENLSLDMVEQIGIKTNHLVHAGMYARSIMIPADVVLTGALINIATTLVIYGNVAVYIGDKTIELTGYNVIPASAHRKQAFVAKSDTYVTMIFKTDATTVEEAEEQFTSEAARLMSRQSDAQNHVVITGE